MADMVGYDGGLEIFDMFLLRYEDWEVLWNCRAWHRNFKIHDQQLPCTLNSTSFLRRKISATTTDMDDCYIQPDMVKKIKSRR